MIIGIDAREGAKTQRAGKGEYVFKVITELIKHSEHTFVLFLDRDLPEIWDKKNVKVVVLKYPSFIWQFLVFLHLEFLRPVDIYFSTTSVIIPALVRSVPVATTLFDFVSFIFPSRHNLKAVLLEKMWMKWAIKFSKKLFAISQNTKADAIKLFKVSAKKITITPLAPVFGPGDKKINLNYVNPILFIGTLEPRKNIVRLLEAFEQLRRDEITATLVLVGGWGWQSKEIRAAIEENPFKKDIKVLGYVKNIDKKFLYRQAKVFAFPTLYEGFGLPPLEAMACGTPVVTSNNSSLPEVVEDAAVLIDPYNSNDLHKALKKVIANKDFRYKLVEKGKKQANKFSWEATAQKTLAELAKK